MADSEKIRKFIKESKPIAKPELYRKIYMFSFSAYPHVWIKILRNSKDFGLTEEEILSIRTILFEFPNVSNSEEYITKYHLIDGFFAELELTENPDRKREHVYRFFAIEGPESWWKKVLENPNDFALSKEDIEIIKKEMGLT